MPNIEINVPTLDQDLSGDFYKKMGFKQHYNCFDIPDTRCTVVLMNSDLEFEELSKNLPIFKFFIEKNFLTYCQNLITNDIKFKLFSQHPGGYTARVIDPSGNSIEMECNEFEDDNQDSIDPKNWSFYIRY